MNRKSKGVRAALLAGIMALTVTMMGSWGCASIFAAQQGGGPAVIYYAAKADFNEALFVALEYAALPSTSLKERQRIAASAQEADRMIDELDALVEAGEVTDDAYSAAAAAIRAVSAEIRRRGVE